MNPSDAAESHAEPPDRDSADGVSKDAAPTDSALADDAVRAGQAVYSPRTLALYDLVVLGVSNRFVWRCPTKRLLRHYDEHVSSNHLDVGVGSGYFLTRCRFPSENPRLVLMDLNEHCLAAAAKRAERYRPQTICRNVLEPIEYAGEPFASIGLNYVLHCLPGPFARKAAALDHLAALLLPEGTLFGSTILASGVPVSLAARKLSALYNRRGIFSHADDSLDALTAALEFRFHESRVETLGCVALFAAKVPRQRVVHPSA